MTESELLAHAADSYPNSFTCFAMFVTMLTGYLITAYVAGGDLIRSQVVIINSLYLVLAGGTIYGGFMFLLVAEDSEVTAPGRYVGHQVTIILCLALAASLKFIWDVRHPKAG